MSLPNQLELQTLFSGFLFETGLSAVSVKNYLSDLRHFFSFCASISTEDNPPSVQEIFQSISKYLNLYLTDQKKSFTPQNTINRRSASIRRFSTFLAVKFGLVSSLQEASEVSKNTPSSNISPKNSVDNSLPTISKILEHFKVFLIKEKKTHSTVKNYISDLNHFFAWSANETPFLDQNLENILSESHLSTYVTYLRLSHTSTSVINRRQSSIKQFTRYCFLQKYIPTNPFEYKRDVPKLLPLSWLERLSGSKNKHHPSGPKSRLATLYQKYNSLPFTPYLHLAILVLATSAMVIFGYNQIIKQAAPSSAALPTVPRRQLSFQGRLTDSSATPITTQVDVVFKLFNDPSAGSELYTSGTCQITPDPNGIFNTLIGGGTCGSEIASTVFTENRDVYLEVTVGAETLTPRQQIATVGYALNSETLQGYPASGSATINTVPIVDNNGDINIAAPSPSINSTSGTFNLNGQALTLTTTANSGGNIVLQPDAIGGGQVQVLGSTTSTDTLRIENANLTSGALISGYIGNDTATGRLLSLTAGSTETDRFYVAANGQVMINTAASLANAGLIIDQNGSGDLFTASASGTSKFTIQNNGNILATGTLTGLTGLTVASGTVSLPNGEINNAEISELDWTKLQNYPSACPAGQAVQAVGDTLTCVDISEQLWQRTDGSLAPINITDSLNLGSTATSSALVHLAGTADENSWINTGNFGVGLTNPGSKLTVVGTVTTSGGNISLNNDSNFTTNINTGTSTGAVTIGGGSNTVAINSTSWDISTLGVASGFTGISSSGDIDFSSLNVGGLVKAAVTTGRLSIASAGTDYEVPLTFSNGLTRTVNEVKLGGTLTADTDIPLAGFNLAFSGTGNVGIGLTNPSYKLDVSGDINLTGAIRDNGSAGTSGQVLSSTGTGVEWIDASSVSATNQGWSWDTGVLYPTSITDAINLGNAATASATVHLAGVAGDNSFINTGNFGVGLTNPGSKLTVVGTVTTSGGNISLNNDSNFTTNINTGTSTGAVTIGGGSNTVAINSTSWDISTLGVASGFTGISSSGDIDFSSLNVGGLVKAAVTTGRLSIASAGTDYEVPLTFSNGLTRTVNEVKLGGTLTADTDIPLAGFNLAFSGTGNVGIGLTNPAYELDVVGDINITGSYLANGAPLTASNWQRTLGSLAPLNITDSLNLGSTATSSALVHLAGTTDENSWINTGNFGIGLTNPTYDLDVTGDINLTGALYDNGSAGTSGQVLSSTGTGVEWIDPPASGGAQYWQWNGGVLSPTDLNDSVTLGATSTASATVHLAGKAGENSFINTGNFGIGLTNPTAGKLQVAGGNIIVDSTYGLDTVGAGTLALGNTNATIISIGTSATARAITLGNSTGATSVTLNGGTGNSINVGTNAIAHTVTVGNITGATAVNVNTGTGGTTYTTTNGIFTLNTGTGNISLGTDAAAKAIIIGNSTGATSVSLNGGTGNSINVGTNAIAHTVTIGNITGATAVNVNTGTGGTTYTTTNGIFTLNTGTGNISLGTDAAAKTITLGNATGATALAINSGTGDIILTSTDQIKLNSSKTAGGTTTEALSFFSTVDLAATDELFQVGDSAANMLTILGDGSVGIGLTNPAYELDVVGDVNITGDYLVNGSAIRQSFWQRTDGSLAPLNITDSLNLGSTATSSALVHLAGTADENSWINTGNFGIGITNPAARLAIQTTGTTDILNLFETGGTEVMTVLESGNVGIGVTDPNQLFQVGTFFAVDTANSRIGIGVTNPATTLEFGIADPIISNTSGDITFNSASDIFDFSGDSLTNFLDATAIGQITLGNYTDAGRPVPISSGSLIYSTTQNNPQYYDGASWKNISNYFSRLATGTVYPTNWFDSINVGYPSGADGASSSAGVRISGDATNSSFFANPVAFGFRTDDPSTSYIKQPRTGYTFAIQTQGGILPRYTGSDLLGYENHEWAELHLSDSIVKGGLGVITLNDLSLNTDVWHATSGFKVGTGAISAGIEFEVIGDTNITQTLSVGGQVTVGGGAGKMDVGTVDPPYTINGKKYATYMASMIGIKEETVGKVTTTTSDYIEGLGYRTLIDLDQQPVGSDVWLFSQTTNIQAHISDLSVLLTPEGQAKAWYEVDEPNKILAIYSSTPTNISYRLTAPRFDSHRWPNIRTSGSIGHVINNYNVYDNYNSIFENNTATIELIAKNDNSGTYLLNVNGVENKEVSTFMNSIVANLKVGAATAISLITDNLTVRTKLISPIADIDQLKVIDATVSGTLYADNIKGQTVDNINTQINLLDERYSTASAILADLQAKYGTYASLFGATSNATVTNDPLALSPLDETTPIIPSDLALNSLNVHTLIANDLLANGSIFTQSISAFDTDLYIQPAGDKLVNISNNLMVLYPNGKVVINGDLLVTGNVLAQGLTSETATVSGTLAVGSSSISTGSANFAQLTTSGLIIASGNDPMATISGQTNTNTTIGEATIAPSTGGISIINSKVTPTTLIYITPTSDTEGRVLYVKSKTEGVGFTVGITGNANNPQVSFNYWLVETK